MLWLGSPSIPSCKCSLLIDWPGQTLAAEVEFSVTSYTFFPSEWICFSHRPCKCRDIPGIPCWNFKSRHLDAWGCWPRQAEAFPGQRTADPVAALNASPFHLSHLSLETHLGCLMHLRLWWFWLHPHTGELDPMISPGICQKMARYSLNVSPSCFLFMWYFHSVDLNCHYHLTIYENGLIFPLVISVFEWVEDIQIQIWHSGIQLWWELKMAMSP